MCAIGNEKRELTAIERIPTTTPSETLARVKAYFESQSKQFPIQQIGVCSFGPIDLRPTSNTYRQIIHTPKPGWSGVDIPGYLEEALRIPTRIDTDVNGAAMSEAFWGNGQGVENFIYLTIGTGIGGGAMVNRKILHGQMHPELGHIQVRHDLQQDPYPGMCPFHGDCFEGLASGPAMQARWGKPAFELPADHPAWDLEAQYIADALGSYIYTLSPQRIILGGGVMQNKDLFPLIRAKLVQRMAGYLTPREDTSPLGEFITSPGLDQNAGLLGAIALVLSDE